jgi:streptogramin lyase
VHKHRLLHCILIAALLALFPAVSGPAARADLTAQETDLAENGQAWEANLDTQGMLWVSHLSPAEIWRIDTQTGVITVYPVGGQPSDGRGDGAGALWWADLGSNRLRRLSTADNQVKAWEIPGSTGLYTTALDPQGRVWVTDFSDPHLYRLDPATNQVCTYSLPDEGLANYLEAGAQYVWFGDYINNRIVRLHPLDGTFTWWQLPGNGFPLDLTLDAGGDVWWTDTYLNYLGRLDPAQESFTAFDLPAHFDPQMLSIAGSQVWLSFQDPDSPAGGVGRLDPAAASGTVHDAARIIPNRIIVPVCTTISPSAETTLTPSTHQADWSAQNYPVTYSQGGWLAFQLPENGSPFGIVADAEVWLVDQGRSKLARLSYPAQVTACALWDADGDLATSGDRTPLPGWPLYLAIAGERQMPAVVSGPDGCATWSGLQPGLAYGAAEDVPNGWEALTPPDHDFSVAAPNQAYSHTFVAKRSGSVTYLPLLDR